jgi:mRNA-degrading endonuclease RelE of RelBE toxin-antitoxin system
VLDSLSLSDFKRIDEKIQTLRKAPRGRGRKKLGEDIYRVRIGRFRIICHVDDEQQLIRIGKVDRRREDTYKDIEDLFR